MVEETSLISWQNEKDLVDGCNNLDFFSQINVLRGLAEYSNSQNTLLWPRGGDALVKVADGSLIFQEHTTGVATFNEKFIKLKSELYQGEKLLVNTKKYQELKGNIFQLCIHYDLSNVKCENLLNNKKDVYTKRFEEFRAQVERDSGGEIQIELKWFKR